MRYQVLFSMCKQTGRVRMLPANAVLAPRLVHAAHPQQASAAGSRQPLHLYSPSQQASAACASTAELREKKHRQHQLSVGAPPAGGFHKGFSDALPKAASGSQTSFQARDSL